ncbi:hypothetical protein INS49_003884 [Diaporthe citri]|uniref:uncharacterized protein n=1 Tax=Diaporthe citri TaxID=83186 RepID=UPI001C80ABEE|nr:uncharacterized protein INS49_003884 [Diaporthe citri]KAG6354803.1 hypothetical protein INS49_003884 [Diaporthe citri]
MEFPPPRRRETLPARLGATQQQQGPPATVPGTTYATPPGLGYGGNPQPVYYAPVYPAGPSSGPYYAQPAFHPQQQVHYVQAVDRREESEETSRPRISETPRHRSPSPPREVERREIRISRPKRTRFADDEYYGYDSDSSSPRDRAEIPIYHNSSRGSGYTENDSSTVYSFFPTRASRAPSSSRTAKTDDEEVEKSENGSVSQESGASRVRATYVFESRYTGESRLGDPHTVKLSVQKTTAVKQKHLFRWIHTTRSSMNFDEFANIASQVPALDASERKAIAQLLPRVKRKFVKTIQTSTGKDVQYMEPAVMPYRIPDGGKNRSIASRTAAWVCLPYFSLENYSGLLSAENSAEFPVQTLLQAQFSKTARERDMQQAVCQIGRRGNGRCFHIAQLWCLIVDKSLLLTYGRMTEDALCAESREAMTKITIENTMAQPAGVDESVLNEHLLEIEDFLLNQTNFTDRKAYRSCNPSSRNNVHGILEKRGSILSQSPDSSSRDQVDYEEVVDIFNTADIIFRFFFPADSKVATVGKFWGAVKLLVELDIVVPDDLKNAWLHLTMGLIFVPHDDVMSETLLVHAQLLIEEGIENIVKSLSGKSLMENAVISPIELCTLMGLKMLQDSTAGLPDIGHTYSAYLESVAADISNKPSDRLHERRIGLLKQELSVIMKTLNAQHRIVENLENEFKPQVIKSEYMASTEHPNIGYEYSKSLVEREPDFSRVRSSSRIHEGPARSHVHDVEYPRSYVYDRPRYRDERDREIRTHAGYYEEDPYVYHTATQSNPDFKLAPTDVGGFRKLFAEECFRHVERRKREFGEFRHQATLLEEENQNKVETTKDRQERAIYAFTIVTVIFLPLSSVASIFGINTKDVRDTELGQWAYWATAVPVTAAVVFFGLLWTGELGNILRWVSFGPHVRRRAYQRIPDDYWDGDPLMDRYSRGPAVLRLRERERPYVYRSRSPSPPPLREPPVHFIRRREAIY